MKKIICIIALCLALLMPISAMADAAISSHEASDIVYMGTLSNTYVVQSAGGYQIFAADGTAIGPVWPRMAPYQNGKYYQVLNNGKINMVTAQGEVVLTDDYFGFSSPDDGWIIGIVMEETTDATPDYTSKAGVKMNLLRADVVVGNQMVGSLERGQYMPTASTGVIGDYLYVLHEDGRCVFFDKTLKQTAEITTAEKPEEFMQVDGKYIHVPTQQPAFCAECTLTEDQVSQTVIVDGLNVIGLQGQVIATLPADGHISAVVHNGYVREYAIAGKSLWDSAGNVVVPYSYNLAGEGYTSSSFYLSGYQMALTYEGDLFCYDTAGNVTASLTGQNLKSSNCNGFNYNSPILAIGSNGGYSLFSATHGLLSGTYEDYEVTLAPVISVCLNGAWGCVALDGTVVVPFEFSRISISADGTLMIGMRADGSWGVYNVEY